MAQEKTYSETSVRDDKIDLLEIVKHLWSYRKNILFFALGGVVFGLVVAFLSPNEFSCTSKLIPESSGGSGSASSLLQRYGGILGIGSGGSSVDGISPELYPKIIVSSPFRRELLKTQIYFENKDTTVSVFGYFSELHNPGFLPKLMAYTVGLPGTIKRMISKPKTAPKVTDIVQGQTKVEIMDPKELAVMDQILGRVLLSSDAATGVISITCEMPDRYAAAQMTQRVIELLEKYATDYKTDKATEDLKFIQKQLEEVEAKFEDTQRDLASYQDSNRGVVTAVGKIKLDQLRSKYNLAFNIYNTLLQQYEDAKIAVQKSTPVFTPLEPAVVPLDKSSPKRLQILLLFTFLGTTLAIVRIFAIRILKKIEW